MKFGFLFLIGILLIISGCNTKPIPEKLPLSVKSNLKFLQENPQFVMYLNFKSMRETNFWKDNISDSLLNAEKTFGSILNAFKEVTGASISNGLDELYYSNSWIGENAIVMKGIFDKEKLNQKLESDSTFIKTSYTNGVLLYTQLSTNLNFFFKDNFTLCASNFLKQIDNMIAIQDTSISGLLLNKDLMQAIDNINYKENLWMVSTEKSFIRGVFMNFTESKFSYEDNNLSQNTDSLMTQDTISFPDTTMKDTQKEIDKLYKNVNSISFSVKMQNELNFTIQAECIDLESSNYFKNLIVGMITLSKFSFSKNNNEKQPLLKILEKTNVDVFDNMVYLSTEISNENVKELKENKIQIPR